MATWPGWPKPRKISAWLLSTDTTSARVPAARKVVGEADRLGAALLGAAGDVKEQETAGIGDGGVQGRRDPGLEGGVLAEGVDVEAPGDGAAAPHQGRQVIGGAVQQDDATQRGERDPARGEIGRIGADKRGEMGTGAVADDDDPLGIDAVPAGVVVQAGDGGGDVLRLLLRVHFRDEAVIDRGEGIAAGEEVRLQVPGHAFVAERPGAAVQEDDERRVLARAGVEIELLARMLAVGDDHHALGRGCPGALARRGQGQRGQQGEQAEEAHE